MGKPHIQNGGIMMTSMNISGLILLEFDDSMICLNHLLN